MKYFCAMAGRKPFAKENFQSNFQPVRSTGTYHEKLLSLELTMRVFLVERAHHGFFC